ncbi:unnamed protein product, partial [Leptidea sinapis]
QLSSRSSIVISQCSALTVKALKFQVKNMVPTYFVR